jgi:haloalkane dehalogenase
VPWLRTRKPRFENRKAGAKQLCAQPNSNPRYQGDRSKVTPAEVDVYQALLLRDDGGRAYLEIMRRLRESSVAEERWAAVVDSRRAPYPIEILWGADDPILRLRRQGWDLLRASGLDWMSVLPTKHFLQEDKAPEVAAAIAEHAARRTSS